MNQDWVFILDEEGCSGRQFGGEEGTVKCSHERKTAWALPDVAREVAPLGFGQVNLRDLPEASADARSPSQ